MKPMKFKIAIHASRHRVWDVLWQDTTFREWASIIDPGTYMLGDLTEGSEVQFISSENGYGVTSLVEKIIPDEYLLFRHQADTQDSGNAERDKQWTGGAETYQLAQESDVTTTLTVTFDVPRDLVEYFKTNYPKALQKVKELAEK